MSLPDLLVPRNPNGTRDLQCGFCCWIIRSSTESEMLQNTNQAYKNLTENVAQCLQKMSPGEEYCCATGAQEHIIYINFINRDGMIIRIDNLGAGSDDPVLFLLR